MAIKWLSSRFQLGQVRFVCKKFSAHLQAAFSGHCFSILSKINSAPRIALSTKYCFAMFCLSDSCLR